jgi:TetR/AcrR family transcriptional regulator, cholesterol catabolism regulator
MDKTSGGAQPDQRRQPLGLRKRKKQETAERIYRTALKLFRERGYEATTVEEIAQAAEVAKGTFFNYFPTKDAVLSYLGQRQMHVLDEAMVATVGFDTWPVYEQLAFVFETLAAGIQDEREFVRVVSQEVFRSASAFSDTTSSSRQLYELFVGMIRGGQERGELRATVLADSMALILIGTYFYTFFAWLELENPPALALMLRVHLDLLLQGMKST